MSLPKNYADREYQKFVEDTEGNTAVRVHTSISDKDGDQVGVNTDGSINVQTKEAVQLMRAILIELRKLNLQARIATGDEIKLSDLEKEGNYGI